MKKRIPVDIQFLMESILTEDPDTVKISDEQKAKLISKGADISKDFESVDWGDGGAMPFYIDKDTNVLVFSEGTTHGSMERALKDAAIFCRYPSEFKKKYQQDLMSGMIGFKTKVYGDKISIYFFGLKENSYEGMRQYLIENRRKIIDLEIRGSGKELAVELSGRLWEDHNIVSFWNSKSKLDSYLPIIFKFIKQIGGNPTKYVYQFIDSKSFYTYNTLNAQVADDEKLTPEEIKALQGKLHLMSAKEKKEALIKLGYKNKKYEEKAEIADKLGMTVAELNSIMNMDEGHIKLKDLLKEDPDSVRSDDRKEGSIAWWSDDDAVAFFAFEKFSIYFDGGTHGRLIDLLYEAYTYEREGFDPMRVIREKASNRVGITDLDGLIYSLTKGPLSDFFADVYDNDTPLYGKEDSGEFRTKSGGLAGRVWKDKKIISFWNTRQDVLKKWKDLEKLFSSTSEFGKLPEYKIDWLEREINPDEPMTPVSKLTSSSDSKEKYAGDVPISPEELKKLQKGLHKMQPAEKKEALKKLGIKNMKYEQLAAIADKLGMTVAEFNHIMNVNEETS